MAGTLIPVAPRQTYTFANLASGNTVVSWLGNRAYPSLHAVSGVLMVRLSSGSSILTGSTVEFEVVNVVLSQEEPNQVFVMTGNVGSHTFASTDTPPILGGGAITADSIGLQVAVRMTYTQGATTGTSTIIAAVDLILRDA